MSTVEILAIGDHNFPDMAEWICDTHVNGNAMNVSSRQILTRARKGSHNKPSLGVSEVVIEKEVEMEDPAGISDIEMDNPESRLETPKDKDTEDKDIESHMEQVTSEQQLKSDVPTSKRARSISPQSGAGDWVAKQVRVDKSCSPGKDTSLTLDHRKYPAGVVAQVNQLVVRNSGSSEGPVGISHSAVTTRETKAKMMSGEFVMDERRLERFKQEIQHLDSHADFLFGEKWKIYHSKCQKWYVMNEAYSAKIFRNHCNGAKGYKACRAKGEGSTKTIGNYFVSGNKEEKARQSCGKSESGPCGGITEAVNTRVAVYLTRTGDDGGGAPSVNSITKELYPRYRGHYSHLSAKKKAAVDKTQAHRRTWRIDRKQQAVYSTICQKIVAKPLQSSSSIYLCTECNLVNSSQAFKSAL
jgi:hypothetical protein